MTCSITDCDRPVKSRGWCTIHYSRWYKTGDPLSVPTRQRGVITDPYSTAHMLVRNTRGRAADYACVDCGNPASDWSFRQQEHPDQTFSLDPNDYDPRCRSCHWHYDHPPV